MKSNASRSTVETCGHAVSGAGLNRVATALTYRTASVLRTSVPTVSTALTWSRAVRSDSLAKFAPQRSSEGCPLTCRPPRTGPTVKVAATSAGCTTMLARADWAGSAGIGVGAGAVRVTEPAAAGPFERAVETTAVP